MKSREAEMLGTQNLLVFVASGILLNLTPGQDTMYILTRSVVQGRRAGVLSAAGIACGTIVHTFAAAFGLSAILATSAHAFTIVKMAGAAYLVYIGATMLFRRAADPGNASGIVGAGSWTIFRAGFFTNLLNPKVALFFLAFLPQFVSPSAPSKATALLFLGSLFICTGTIWCLTLALGGAAMSRRLRAHPSAGDVMRRMSGAVFVGLGVRLAVNE